MVAGARVLCGQAATVPLHMHVQHSMICSLGNTIAVILSSSAGVVGISSCFHCHFSAINRFKPASAAAAAVAAACYLIAAVGQRHFEHPCFSCCSQTCDALCHGAGEKKAAAAPATIFKLSVVSGAHIAFGALLALVVGANVGKCNFNYDELPLLEAVD